MSPPPLLKAAVHARLAFIGTSVFHRASLTLLILSVVVLEEYFLSGPDKPLHPRKLPAKTLAPPCLPARGESIKKLAVFVNQGSARR